MIDIQKYRTDPLYISDFQKWIANLPVEQCCEMVICIRLGSDGRCRWLTFLMPSDRFLSEFSNLAERYLLAMMNNMVVSFGGEIMELYFPTNNSHLVGLCQSAAKRFQVDTLSHKRTEYGTFVNYINRINKNAGLSPFRIILKDISLWQTPSSSSIAKIYEPRGDIDERETLRRAATLLNGKCFCSLDVGGNSIKCAVVRDGNVLLLKEHKWFPAGCKTADELLGPILSLTELLRGCAALCDKSNERVNAILSKEYSDAELSEPVKELAKEEESQGFFFDAVVIGFPDIVISNKISGGETSKQTGMKKHSGENYERDFAKTVNLDDMVRRHVKPDGAVVVLNDGNAAAFVTSVELAFSQDCVVDDNGMFANTIGTEMGTGFISPAGTIQSFPLEGYQFVVDLGNTDYTKYSPKDIRSINNIGTGIPGTVQKNITQLGLFRLAIVGLMERDPNAFHQLVDKGFLNNDERDDLLTINMQPVDMRGALTRELFTMTEQGHPVLLDTFAAMGKVMGVHIDQCRLIFPELSTTRLLSGGIITPDYTFSIMLNSLRQYNPDYNLIRLDEDIMLTPLLKGMAPDQRNFTVAIGSAFIGNHILLTKQGGRTK